MSSNAAAAVLVGAGDSLTDIDPQASWVSYMEMLDGNYMIIEVAEPGVSCAGARDLLVEYLTDGNSHVGEHVNLMCLTNDTNYQGDFDPVAASRSIAAILDARVQTVAAGATFSFATPPPRRDFDTKNANLGVLVGVLLSLSVDLDIDMVDNWTLWMNYGWQIPTFGANENYFDQVHMSALGAMKLAEAFSIAFPAPLPIVVAPLLPPILVITGALVLRRRRSDRNATRFGR